MRLRPPPHRSTSLAGAIAATRLPWALLACALMTVPLLGVAIVPFTDLPGHMGGFAAATYARDPAFARLMAYRWHLVPNLGTELLVAALQPALGIVRATWWVAAAIPVLLAAGILAVARTLNPGGAAATPWALVFVYSFPLSTGFLNYMLGVAGALLGFAAWIRLDRRSGLREGAAWIAVPAVFLCHAVAGCVLVLLVGGRELGRAWRERRPGAGLKRVRPLLSGMAILLAWRLGAHAFAGGATRFSAGAKLRGLLMLLRDQNLALDAASLLLAAFVFVAGTRRGARPHPAVTPALVLLAVLFLAMPSTLGGADYADARLLPLIPMLAFATQNYGAADRRAARLVTCAGLALLAIRLGATTLGFQAYAARDAVELGALAHIPLHSRVLVLNTRDCSALAHWRTDRLDHLAALAIVDRRSWTNSEWDVDGVQSLRILYRPSARFFDDPSQFVWPAACGGAARRHPTIAEATRAAPLADVDFLWLLNARLPPGFRDPRLVERWHAGGSTLYAVRR